MTTRLMITVLRLRHATKHAPGDKMPCIPIGYHVHAMWFQSFTLLIRIRPSIARYHVRQCVRRNLNLDILLSVCNSSRIICQQLVGRRLSQINASPYRLFGLHYRFNQRPTDTMPTHNLMCQLISNTCLTSQCTLTQTNEQGCFRRLMFSQRHNSLSHVMLRPRPFSLAGE